MALLFSLAALALTGAEPGRLKEPLDGEEEKNDDDTFIILRVDVKILSPALPAAAATAAAAAAILVSPSSSSSSSPPCCCTPNAGGGGSGGGDGAAKGERGTSGEGMSEDELICVSKFRKWEVWTMDAPAALARVPDTADEEALTALQSPLDTDLCLRSRCTPAANPPRLSSPPLRELRSRTTPLLSGGGDVPFGVLSPRVGASSTGVLVLSACRDGGAWLSCRSCCASVSRHLLGVVREAGEGRKSAGRGEVNTRDAPPQKRRA